MPNTHDLILTYLGVEIYADLTTESFRVLIHCGVPLVREMTARNVTSRSSEPFCLVCELDGFRTAHIQVPALGAGGSIGLTAPDLGLDANAFVPESALRTVELRFSVDEDRSASQRRAVTLMGYWALPCSLEFMHAVAALIFPNDPTVDRLVVEAQRLHGEAFYTTLMCERETPELRIIGVLYDLLCALGIRYELPRMSIAGSQSVRPPYHIFREGIGGSPCAGTCLDLALLFAACLENIGLCPLIVLTADEAGMVRHAFAGCWNGTTPGFHPVVTDARFLSGEVESGDLLLVECTGFAEGPHRESVKLNFGDALESARRQVFESERIFAVDVTSLRPPYGSITPIGYPAEEGEAVSVFRASADLARSKRKETLETIHLLYGLISARGPICRRLMDGLGLDAGAVCTAIADHVREGNYSSEPSPTRNYRECERFARHCAQISGVPLGEEHLWWAIHEKPSKNLSLLCARLGITLELIPEVLRNSPLYRLLQSDQSSVGLDMLPNGD